jgi:hypothetical protein
MAEAVTEEIIAPVAEALPEEAEAPVTEPEQPPVVGETDEDGEPGGSDGASVYARKKAREAKQLRADFEQERQDRIRAEERARVLEEQARKPAAKEAERIFSPDEVEAAVTNGTITRSQATVYLARVEAQRVRDEAVAQQQAHAPVERARGIVLEYCQLMPALNDEKSPEFARVAAKYHELVGEGHPADFRARRLAAELVFGDLATIKRRQEVTTLSRRAPNMPSDGNGGQPPARANDHTKAPAEAQDLWNKMGLSAADRAKDWARLQKK